MAKYLQKPDISWFDKANLYKILGSVLMMSEDKFRSDLQHEKFTNSKDDIEKSENSFKLAIKYFSVLDCQEGVAQSKYLILKSYIYHLTYL